MSNWSIAEVREALSKKEMLFGGKYDLELKDPERRLGVGVGPTNSMVLLVPGFEGADEYEGMHFRWNPWITVKFNSKAEIDGVGCLEVVYPNVTNSEIDALSAIYLGILAMVDTDLDGERIDGVVRSLGSLFEARLNQSVTRENLVGLIGELVVILVSTDPDHMIEAWHNELDDIYDFSVDNHRLEVKTTSKVTRQHFFSSVQLPPSSSLDVIIASVVISQVAIGINVSKLINTIIPLLKDEDNQSKLMELCNRTLRNQIESTGNFEFDLDSAIRSIRYFTPAAIPTPTSAFGIVTISWSAILDEMQSLRPEKILDGVKLRG